MAAIHMTCREDLIAKYFKLSEPRAPCKLGLCGDRAFVRKQALLIAPEADGVDIVQSPSWVYRQQYLLMEAIRKWIKDIQGWSDSTAVPNAQFLPNYWASSPLLSKVLAKGYRNGLEVQFDASVVTCMDLSSTTYYLSCKTRTRRAPT
jgi:hypothetical protein